MKRASLLWLMLILHSLWLAGCASSYGPRNTEVYYYPRCYQPIQDLRSREHQVGRSTAGGAIIGALGGALLGLLAGDGNLQGALVGAAAGGVGGGMMGHAYGSSEQAREDNRRLASYYQNMEGDIYNMDIATAAARTSLKCYDDQFKILLGAIKAKKIDRRTAAARFAEIQAGREEAINILGDVAYTGDSLEMQYEKAFLEEEQEEKTRTGMARPARKNGGAMNAARQKKKEMAKKAEAAREERAMAQNNTARQTESINEAMARLEELKI